MTVMALLVAIGVLSSSVIAIPVGAAKALPVQHAINVIGAVLMGPVQAGLVALLIALLRMLLGTGTPLAIPGGMVGALLAGYLYRRWRVLPAAMIGELVGTGIIGALLSYPVARFLLGKNVAAFFFVIPFGLSSLSGVILAGLLLPVLLPAYKRLGNGSGAERLHQ
ncbi:MAG: energy coupling factor transporter S component ThiW [Symbiobacteriia bacterium]